MSKIKLLWFSAFLVYMSSCDTRDDYFLEYGDAPIIDITTSNDTMNSEFWEGKKYRVIEVGFGKSDTLNFSVTDPYGKECSYDFQFESIPNDNILNNVSVEELYYYFGKEICTENVKAKTLDPQHDGLVSMDRYYEKRDENEPLVKITKTKGKIIFSLKEYDTPSKFFGQYLDALGWYTFPSSLVPISDRQYWLSKTMQMDIPMSKEVSARYSLTATNKIGLTNTEYIVVKVKPNRQPIPTINIKLVDKKTNEYKITVGGSDADGHRIVKWSYLFDQTPYKIGSVPLKHIPQDRNDKERPIFNGFLFYDCYSISSNADQECFYYFTFGKNKEEMEGDTETDFITPTKRNEINHIFQTKGEHTVSVRCQDEYGLWSDYVTEKIYIE